MEQQQDYYYSEEEESSHQNPTLKNKKRDNTKRFSDEQVKLLESVFSRGAKLEPRKKLQLARDIGLQPRQVSIWFQNKRARWKTKQLEEEYRVLKDKFDKLYEKFESLKKEKESLLDQFNTLRRLLENGYDEHNNISKNASTTEVKEENINEEMLYEDEQECLATKYFREEDKPQIVNFSGQEGSLLASHDEEQHHNLVSGCHFDELCCPSSWWEL